MARITTNTTGTQPIITLSTSTSGGNLTIPFLQDITVTNSTGVYAYTTFTDADKRKLSTPADNEISTNTVIDDLAFFGNSAATANTAAFFGLLAMSTRKELINFTIDWAGANSRTSNGSGFITSIAAKTSPEAPVWVTPINIAVDGAIGRVD
ncbi:MAG: hypothetical protein ACOVLB_07290 [Candidatus Nanopelagicus sp.]